MMISTHLDILSFPKLSTGLSNRINVASRKRWCSSHGNIANVVDPTGRVGSTGQGDEINNLQTATRDLGQGTFFLHHL